jgi:hypothetical protein
MKDKELLKNFKKIRQELGNLNKMVFLIASQFYDFEGEESSGKLEKDIEQVQPKKNYRGYLG